MADPAVVPAVAVAPAVTVGVLDVEDDPAAVGPAADDDDEDDDGGGGAADVDDEDDDDVSVAPETLSGAFGWPPSSGDGAILESVKRREIISGRQRRRPPCTGAPGTFLFL